MSSLPETTDVFICGGGPSGMAAAMALAHHSPETRITIVDMMSAQHRESRAFTIHCRTMEVLKEINAADALERGGKPTPAMNIRNQNHPLIAVESWQLHNLTSFPFVLLISQWRTEAILAKYLEDRDIKVLRPYKVVALEEAEDALTTGYKFLVTFEGGQTLKAKYIIGADGSKSTIRGAASIGFTQLPSANGFMSLIHKPPEVILLADITFAPDTSREFLAEISIGLRYTLGPLGLFLIVPLFDDITVDSSDAERENAVPSYFRLVFFLTPDEVPRRQEAGTIPFLQERLERSCFKIPTKSKLDTKVPQIDKLLWANTYRVRFCVADQFVKTFSNGGNLILIGDAAHVHSPASGQGMNVGICDGLETGLAIAEHIRTGDGEVFIKLDKQLKKVATGTLMMTRTFGWVGYIHGPISRVVRDWIMWTIGRFAPLRRKMALRVSGLAFLKTK